MKPALAPAILAACLILGGGAAPSAQQSANPTVDEVRRLVRAGQWESAHARVDALDPDDPAWIRLPAVIYEEGIARNDLPATIERLSRAAAATTTPAIKAAALVIVGRAYRRQGDKAAATQALEAATAAAPGPRYAEEARTHLRDRAPRVGLPAPPVSGKPPRPVPSGVRSRDRLRAAQEARRKQIFWGTT